MLQPRPRWPDTLHEPAQPGGADILGQADLARLLAAARRQLKIVVVCVLAGLVFGAAYLLAARPVYTATARVLIDPGNRSVGERDERLTLLGLDVGLIESQVELAKSEAILNAVVDDMALLDDPAFGDGAGSPLGSLRRTAGLLASALRPGRGEPAGDEARYSERRGAIGTLRKNLSVGRVGQTYIMELAYTASGPGLAAAVANGVAEAFISDQLEARFEAARRTGEWMQARIEELKRRSLAADHAVQDFRAANGLIAADGRLVGDQQLSELNTQLILARAERSKAEAKYERIRSILDSGNMDAAVTEALSNTVITSLRAKYLDASKRRVDLEGRLGPAHAQVVALEKEMAEYERMIFSEIGRIAESYESDFQVARTREEALRRNLDLLVGDAASANETLVGLRELEREAETVKTLYESFLQRYQQVIQEQTFPMAEARIIAPAVRPLRPSGPKTTFVLAAFLSVGAVFGVALGALREMREHGFRSGAQVRDELGLEPLGSLPIVHPLVDAPRGSAPGSASAADPPPGPSPDRPQGSPRLIAGDGSILRHVLREPMSHYAETLRAAKVAADLALGTRKPKIVGIVSALPDEGKSTVAKNFASLLALHGARTLLVDGDIRNPGLSRAVAPQAEAGLVEALQDGLSLRQLLLLEPDSRLLFLPTTRRSRPANAGMLLASARMSELLAEASAHLDYIVVDLPPLGPVVDVRAASAVFDAFVLVVEWGATPRRLVRTVLDAERAVRDKCLGVVLNKVDVKRMRLYEAYNVPAYYDPMSLRKHDAA